MEYIIIAIISGISIIILGYIFDYNLKKIKGIVAENELDEIAKEYPSNLEICKWYLKKLKNEKVKIEESKEKTTSLYIAITDKIIIANIANTYTRIQTIAHECIHSVQDRRLVKFNFVFSNIYLIYYILICILTIFKILPNKMLFLVIFLIFSLIYYMVRIYLENDAMINAKYLAKDYMEDVKISSKLEIEKIVDGFNKINNIGIKCINYNFFFKINIKIMIFCIIAKLSEVSWFL